MSLSRDFYWHQVLLSECHYSPRNNKKIDKMNVTICVKTAMEHLVS